MPDLNIPNNVYSDEDGAVFVQSQAGTETFYIGNCIDVGDIPNPRGGKEPEWCLNSNREHVVVGSKATAPGTGAVTVSGLMEGTANWLETYVENFCPFWLYFIQHKCGTRGLFSHWERASVVKVEAVTEDTISGLASREGGNASMRAFNMSYFSPRIDNRNLTVSRKTTTQTLALNDVSVCDKRCPTVCEGSGVGLGQEIQAGADANAGAATFLHSHDYGVTWGAPGNDPFANGEDILSHVCFDVDKDNVRWLATRELDGGAMEVAYTDDGAATAWTAVTVGATVGEAVAGPQGLFAFDFDHVWTCTLSGNVYFSSDGGATWTDQDALAASGAASLSAISFYDANVGYAVGASDVVIKTIDGGANWTAATATGGGGTNNTVQTWNGGEYVIVGESGGEIYISWDGAATWTLVPAARHPGSGAGSVNCISMFNELSGLAVHTQAVLHTIDGGYTWTALTTPANSGLNSVIMISPTQGWAVGEANGGTAVILEIGTL
jgi:photosystem II stability/assembly factor-like uncharacterized protein